MLINQSAMQVEAAVLQSSTLDISSVYGLIDLISGYNLPSLFSKSLLTREKKTGNNFFFVSRTFNFIQEIMSTDFTNAIL